MNLKKLAIYTAIISIYAVGPVVGAYGFIVLQTPREKTLSLIITLIISSVVLALFSKNIKSIFTNDESKILLLFIAVSMFSCLLAQISGQRQNTSNMWRYAAQAFVVTINFWGCFLWSRKKFDVKPVETGLIFASLICICSVIMEAYGIISYESYGRRFFGFMGDNVAWILSLSTCYFLFRKKYLLLILSVFSLFLTQSRGAFLIAISCIILGTSRSTKSLKNKFYYIVASIGSLFFVAVILPEFFSDIISRFFETQFLDNDRIRTINFTLSVFSDNPIFGAGYGAHTYYHFETFFGKMRSGHEIWATPVSTWFQVLADFGLIGFLVFFIFMAMVIKKAFGIIFSQLDSSEHQALVGLSVWFVSFILLNHFAVWLVPSSYISPIVFATAGIIIGVNKNAYNKRMDMRSINIKFVIR